MNNIQFVSKSGMCTGCGMCVSVCPQNCISMNWDKFEDLVANVDHEKCISCHKCIDVCPGYEVDFHQINDVDFSEGVGKNLGIEVLYSKNKVSFSNATSGGIVRELCAYLIENRIVDGAIMITDTPSPLHFPFYSPPKIFTNPDEIRNHNVHSRYCPAPLMTIIKEINDDKKKYVMVGLPCQIHSLRKLQKKESKWVDKIPFVIGLLCSGTPTAKANRYLVVANKVETTNLVYLDYRYGKWPKGVFVFDGQGNNYNLRKMGGLKEQNRLFQMIGIVYMSSYFWRRRCLTCFDFFNQSADVVCGDPWVEDYWKMSKKDGIEGGTLTIIRTRKAELLIENAKEDDVIGSRMIITPASVEKTMGKFQRERISHYKGYQKIASKFKMKIPEYKNCKLSTKQKHWIYSYIDLKKSNIARNRYLWKFLKYFQFIEETVKFLKRKLS